MPGTFAPTSIHSRPLRYAGGIWARVGFGFQDHVAAGYCLDMVGDGSTVIGVWCEGEDDITLIRVGEAGEEVEFVQVKADNPGHYLSVAWLCRRDKGLKPANRVGSSILEKSLAGDGHFDEPRWFRIVSAVRTSDDLILLTFPCGCAARDPNGPAYKSLLEEAERQVGDYRSERGNGCQFWIDRVTWEVRHCEDSVKADNIQRLWKWLERNGVWLLSDQVEELYARLLAKVQEAAKADPRVSESAKKFGAADLRTWLAEEARKIEHPAAGAAGEKLTTKLQAASVPTDDILQAADYRRFYRSEQLLPQYVGREEQKRIERAVSATLHAMRAKLDAGSLVDDGRRFHDACVTELRTLLATAPWGPSTDLAFLLGCMYNIADRCTHRFRRASA